MQRGHFYDKGKPRQQATPGQLCSQVYAHIRGVDVPRIATALLFLNFFILYCRPQDVLPILGHFHLPIILSIMLGLAWGRRVLTMPWTRQSKIMVAFLIMGCLWIPFARNNRWAYFTAFDLLIQFSCMMFPMIMFIRAGRQIRTLTWLWIAIGAYLALYGISHAGVGPGGFVKDENDLCAVLLMILAFPLGMLFYEQRQSVRAIYIVVSFILFTGIIATLSRGGFLGLLVLLLWFGIRSRAKITIAVVALFLGGLAMLFVPEFYWEEMSTISPETSTARERFHTWWIAIRIWLDPWHFLPGVGMENARWWIADYEPIVAVQEFGRSVAGRALHSTYLQLVVDLGAIGLALFVSLMAANYRSLKNVSQICNIYRTRLISAFGNVEKLRREEGQERLPIDDEAAASSIRLSSKELEEIEILQKTMGRVHRELDYLQPLVIAIGGAWLSILAASGFISILYYPLIWTLTSLSVCVELYAMRLVEDLEPLLDKTEIQSDPTTV